MTTSRSAIAASVLSPLGPALAGISASAILVVDYVRVAPVFCAEGGGCDAIRRTAFSSILGVPTPYFGLAGFGAIGIVALLHGQRARIAQLSLAAIAAVVGALLFAIQVRVGHFCPYCCVADASGAASLGVAVWRFVRFRRAAEPAPSPALAIVGGVSLVVAAFAPVAIGMRMTGNVPAVIRAELAAAAGQVAVVDFVDFQCPFCRMTNADLETLIAAHRERIHLVRRQVPLRMHPHARDAARAACCGEQLGQGDAMASALFRTDANDLTKEGCERVAQRLGLSVDAYRACVADPKTDARIDADRQEFKDSGGFALPTIWIGAVPLVGAQSADALGAALDRALARVGS